MILNFFSYRYANRNGNNLCSTLDQISASFGHCGQFRPNCNFRPEGVLPFFFSFFNIRIFFTITCKKILSSTDSILLHSIKYNLKIHNNEVMNTEREVRTRRWTWIIFWTWGRLLMKLQTFTYLQFCSTKRVVEEVLRQRECCELKLKTQDSSKYRVWTLGLE